MVVQQAQSPWAKPAPLWRNLPENSCFRRSKVSFSGGGNVRHRQTAQLRRMRAERSACKETSHEAFHTMTGILNSTKVVIPMTTKGRDTSPEPLFFFFETQGLPIVYFPSHISHHGSFRLLWWPSDTSFPWGSPGLSGSTSVLFLSLDPRRAEPTTWDQGCSCGPDACLHFLLFGEVLLNL